MSEAQPFPALDPARNHLIFVVGRKGSGKSVFAREVFRAWPGVDRLVIDPTGDADPGPGLDTVTFHKLPGSLPVGKRGEHGTYRWVADPQSSTYRDDLDQAVGLALFPRSRPMLLWVDEAAEVFPAKPGPYARTLLAQSRHWHTSAILATPRPINVDPLCISQADRVVMYDTPHPRDRERLAGTIGIPPRVLADELNEIRARGAHWFLIYDAREHALYRCPPLPVTADPSGAQK